MSVAAAVRRIDTRRAVVLALVVVFFSVFVFQGPDRPLGLGALCATIGAMLLLVPGSAALYLVPLCGLALPVPQPIPGLYVFDVVTVPLLAVGLWQSLASGERAAWEVRWPGWLAIAVVLTPLLAVPVAVISVVQFLGVYKNYVLLAGLFLALRRIVPRDRAELLLWVFPLVGTMTSLQLFWKTRGLGAMLFSRLDLRNFYSELGWGRADYLASVIEICICGTVILLLLRRESYVRATLLVTLFLMLEAFLILFSRAGALSLLLFGGILALGWQREKVLLAGSAVLVVAGIALSKPGGQVLIQRFVDPKEYGSWYFRLLSWEVGWERFLTHPWTGIGLNQGRFRADIIGNDSTNSLLSDFLSEQGIPGVILLTALVVAAFRLAARAEGFDGASPRLLRFALVGMVAATILHSLVEPTLSNRVCSILFVYLLAFLALRDSRASGAAHSPVAADSRMA